MTETDSATTFKDEVAAAFEEIGILGFNPLTDAVKQQMWDGIRIWYGWNGELRWVARTRSHQHRWESPVTTSTEDAVRVFDAADELEVINKTTFNRLASGAVGATSGVHQGICWGVALTCGRRIDHGERVSSRTLQAVPGVGEKLSRRIASNIIPVASPGVEDGAEE